MKFVSPLFLLIVAVTLTSCRFHRGSPYLRQHLGENCTVEFRRDALGAASALPISPTTDSINGADVVLSGTLIQVEADAIVVEAKLNRKMVWIPNHAILSVETEKKQ